MTSTCTATKKDGSACTLPAVASGPFCFAHTNPQANRSAGGQATRATERAFRMLPARLRPVFHDLLRLYKECHDGEIDPDRARACAQIARALVLVLQSGQLEERVQGIEKRSVEERYVA